MMQITVMRKTPYGPEFKKIMEEDLKIYLAKGWMKEKASSASEENQERKRRNR